MLYALYSANSCKAASGLSIVTLLGAAATVGLEQLLGAYGS